MGNGTGTHAATHEGEPRKHEAGPVGAVENEVDDVIVWDDDAGLIDGDQADPSTSTS